MVWPATTCCLVVAPHTCHNLTVSQRSARHLKYAGLQEAVRERKWNRSHQLCIFAAAHSTTLTTQERKLFSFQFQNKHSLVKVSIRSFPTDHVHRVLGTDTMETVDVKPNPAILGIFQPEKKTLSWQLAMTPAKAADLSPCLPTQSTTLQAK